MNLLEVLEADNWRGSAVRGAAAVVFGVLALAWPGITALALLYLIAAWAFAVGVTEMVADPGRGVLTITCAIAWFAIVAGVVSLVRAWQVRNAHPQAGAPSATPRQGAVA
jgi:uncharacterized membrane protein HdeD (DUF308 family)